MVFHEFLGLFQTIVWNKLFYFILGGFWKETHSFLLATKPPSWVTPHFPFL